MKIGVLSVQGAVSEHLKMLGLCGVQALAVSDKESLSRVTGLIIPGGESTTIGKLIAEAGLTETIKTRSKNDNLAVFGTCAGMVLMANEVSDGIQGQLKLELMDIKVKRNAFGRQRESFETSLEFNAFEESLTGVFIRAPIVEEASAKVTSLAELPEGIVAARQGNMLVTSFHPELADDLRVHQYFIAICKKL
ncbi:MAG: pyridoxal 5'-phosphate synthase glutaminase subunit PdxT [Bacillota bacterium]